MEEKHVKRKKYKRDPKYRTKKAVIIVVASVFLLVICIVGLFFLVMHNFLSKVNYKELDDNFTIKDVIETQTEGPTGVVETTRVETPLDDVAAYEAAAKAALKKLGEEERELDDIFNILLVGTDARSGGAAVGNSDTTILLSINFNTGQIIMTSFLRDLYVYIPKRECYDKLNSSYQWGGMELLMETIQYNFSITVDYYLSVDFFAFMNVVDIIGGVDVDVQEDELYWLNQYIHSNNLLLQLENEHEGYLDYADGSFQHLNGKQALAYSRFRYVGNADFSRTERQRKVLNLTYEKLKKIDVNTLIKLLDEILPQITTNLSEADLLTLIAKLPIIAGYEIVSWSIPDEIYSYITVDGQSSISIDVAYYVNRMYDYIYGTVDQPAEEEVVQTE